MSTALKFLIVDDNVDSRRLLAQTLTRQHPGCETTECQHGDHAVRLVQRESWSAVIAHRTFDYDGETLIRVLRQANAQVPLVMVSGHDRRSLAQAAGADVFLNYDAWLQIGRAVGEAMQKRAADSEPSTCRPETAPGIAESEPA